MSLCKDPSSKTSAVKEPGVVAECADLKDAALSLSQAHFKSSVDVLPRSYTESDGKPGGAVGKCGSLAHSDIPAYLGFYEAWLYAESNEASPISPSGPTSLDKDAFGREDAFVYYSETERKEQLALEDILSSLELMVPQVTCQHGAPRVHMQGPLRAPGC